MCPSACLRRLHWECLSPCLCVRVCVSWLCAGCAGAGSAGAAAHTGLRVLLCRAAAGYGVAQGLPTSKLYGPAVCAVQQPPGAAGRLPVPVCGVCLAVWGVGGLLSWELCVGRCCLAARREWLACGWRVSCGDGECADEGRVLLHVRLCVHVCGGLSVVCGEIVAGVLSGCRVGGCL